MNQKRNRDAASVSTCDNSERCQPCIVACRSNIEMLENENSISPAAQGFVVTNL